MADLKKHNGLYVEYRCNCLDESLFMAGEKMLEYEFAIHHEIGDLWLVILMCHTLRPCIDERLNYIQARVQITVQLSNKNQLYYS